MFINHINVYIRVSTSKQASDRHNGLNIQLDTCKQYISDNKYSKYFDKNNIYKDIGSTYNYKNKLGQRNKLLKLLTPKTLIVIYSISRIGRNTIETMDFLKKVREKNCIIYSVTDNLYFNKDKLVDKDFYYKVIESEKTSDLKSIACKKNIKNIKKRGGFIGKIPYGYYCEKINNIRKLRVNSREQNIIFTIEKKILYYKKLGKKDAFIRTSEYLNKNNLLYRDKRWTVSFIRYVLLQHKKLDKNLNSNFNKLTL